MRKSAVFGIMLLLLLTSAWTCCPSSVLSQICFSFFCARTCAANGKNAVSSRASGSSIPSARISSKRAPSARSRVMKLFSGLTSHSPRRPRWTTNARPGMPCLEVRPGGRVDSSSASVVEPSAPADQSGSSSSGSFGGLASAMERLHAKDTDDDGNTKNAQDDDGDTASI